MARKALVCFLAALLLLLQFAELSLASETALQDDDNPPKAEGNTEPSLLDEDNVEQESTEAELSSNHSADSPSVAEPQNEDERLATAVAEEDSEKSGKLIAQYTTKTKALFVTTTRTALSTCFSATNTACTGKRRKRSLEPTSLFMDKKSTDDLVSSQEATSPEDREYEFRTHESDRKVRKFTIWTTLFSTHTVTSIFYFPGTTVSISGVCSVAGLGNSCWG